MSHRTSPLEINSGGDLIWQRSLGGSDDDVARNIKQTPTGEYLVSGYTLSNNGDVTNNYGGYDCWLISLCTSALYFFDADLDGYGNPDLPLTSCSAPSGFVLTNTDCNDSDAAINPQAGEMCNSIDDDCDGQTDEDLACTGDDEDADGYTITDGDCNDMDPTINPGAAEVCNSIDDNCNAQVDEGVKTKYFADADGDQYGDVNTYFFSCIEFSGYVTDSTDCNDNDATINISSIEICNGIDDNCNGFTDEVESIYYADGDGDGYGDPNTSVTVQSCTAPTDFVDNNLDCNDADSGIYAGGTEICNQIDDDCDGQTDEDLVCDGEDVDGDSYAVNQGDCNDLDPTINPGAAETCNSIDDNCNAQIDEGVQIQYFADADGDLFGDANNYIYSCIASTGYVADNTDCNDNDATINSSSPEICNGIDDNCNGLTDEVQGTYYADGDADGYGNPNASVTVQSCTAPLGYVSNNLDCNDADAAINPNGTEICNLIDDDCDGQSDEGLACGGEDIDADGYTLVQGDCDDNNPTVHPGAPDLCNGLDDDCNGQTDENAVSVSINPSGTVYSCKNVPITFTASGSNITHYQWYRDDGPVFGETNNTYVSAIASRFHVIASNDFGCSVKSATTLVVPIDLPTATVTVYNDGNLDLCAGTIRLRTNEENNVAYQWYTNGSVIPGATNQDYIPFNVGNYGVMVTDLSTGCFKYSTKIHVTNSCRLNPPDSNNDYTLSIFPNPAVENISIVLITDNDLEGYGTLQVMNTLGQLLYKKEVAMINREVISEINLAGLAEGIYFLNIVTDDKLYSQQFIISH